MKCLVLGLLITAVCPLLPRAYAGEVKSVAVLSVEAQGLPAELADRYSAALKSLVARRAGYKLAPGKSLEEIKLVFGCVDTSAECMARVGSSLVADKLLWGTLVKGSDGLKLTLKVLDVAAARLEKVLAKDVTEKSVAAEVIEGLAEQILTPIFGQILLRSKELGAEVFVGDRKIGATGEEALLVGKLQSGTYVVQVKKDGFKAYVRRVTVLGGAATEVQIVLEALPPPPPPPPPPPLSPPPPLPLAPSRTAWKVAFWATATVAIGAAVGGIVSGLRVRTLEDDKAKEIDRLANLTLGLDGKPTNKNYVAAITNPNENVCAYSNGKDALATLNGICGEGKTMAAAATGLLIGAGAAAAASILFVYKAYIESPEKQGRAVQTDAKLHWDVTPRLGLQGVGVDFALQF